MNLLVAFATCTEFLRRILTINITIVPILLLARHKQAIINFPILRTSSAGCSMQCN